MRSRRVLPIAVAAMGGALVLTSLFVLNRSSNDEASSRIGETSVGPPTPGVASGPAVPSAALVHSTHDEGCRWFRAQGRGDSVGYEDARADAEQLGEDLVSPVNRVNMVGLGTCGGQYVIVVGVRERQVEVPAVGPRGTPVIAHLQSDFRFEG